MTMVQKEKHGATKSVHIQMKYNPKEFEYQAEH